jgi:hypothetical protein
VKFTAKHIPSFYLFGLFTGTLFFIPAIFVNRFTTAPALWMQAGICLGIVGYVLLSKERIPLPLNYPFIRLMAVALLAFVLAANPQNSITISNSYLSKRIILLFSFGLLYATVYQPGMI